MSRYPTGRPTGPGTPRPQPPQGGAPAVTIDPIKLLKKYKLTFGAAFFVSVILGIGAYFALRATVPSFTSEVIFECMPAENDPSKVYTTNVDPDEIDRFMLTEVSKMTSDATFNRVLRDTRLNSEAPTWYKHHTNSGQLDVNDALKTLQGGIFRRGISASVIPETYFIRLSVPASTAKDAAGLARLVREAYLQDLQQGKNRQITDQRDSLADRVKQLNDQITDLQSRRSRIVRDEELDTIDANRSEARSKLEDVSEKLLEVQQGIEAVQVQLERFEDMLTSPAGIQYTDTQRAQAEQNPLVASLQQQLKNLEASRLALQRDGVLPNHRTYRQLEAQIAGVEQKLADAKEEKLREIFDAEVDGTRRTMAQLRAQESDLLTQQETLRTKLTELTGTLNEVTDLKAQIDRLIDQKAEASAKLDDLVTRASLESVGRVRVQLGEQVPNEMSFPKIIIIVPLTVLLVCGLTGGAAVLRELLDQRVKSPADVGLIPRTRVLGVVPLASEDPSEPERVERAFDDQPRGVLAESYRQLRTSLLKSMNRAGHRSLVVASGQPGSGATSVISNLALACAAMDQRVLVIDGNFRRPAMHKVYDAPDTPGLADVLAGETTLAEAKRATEVANLDLLVAGTKQLRIFERLGTEAMAGLLTEAGEDYDLILIDVAPCLVAGDAQALANRADASMLVVRAMGEKRGMVARLKNELSDSRAEFLGVLVNAVRSAAGGYMRKNIRTSHDYQRSEPPVEQNAA